MEETTTLESTPSTPAVGVADVLTLLAQRFAGLWGEQVRPLKRGIFQDLETVLGDTVPRAALKEALARHTRSTPYLRALASGQPRCDLQLQAVEPVSLEHRLGALLELYRRRSRRAEQDPQAQRQAQQAMQRGLQQALQAGDGGRMEVMALTATWPDALQAMVQMACEEYERQRARDAALLAAFEASGQSPVEFAKTWGRPLSQLEAALRRRQGQLAQATAQ